MTAHRFTLIRNWKDDIVVGSLTVRSELKRNKVRAALVKAITDWVTETDKGWTAYKQAARNFGLGDLIEWQCLPSLVKRLAKHGLKDVRASAIVGEPDWGYDDSLVVVD